MSASTSSSERSRSPSWRSPGSTSPVSDRMPGSAVAVVAPAAAGIGTTAASASATAASRAAASTPASSRSLRRYHSRMSLRWRSISDRALGHLAFLLLQLLGLLRQPGRRGRDLLGLFLDLGLPPLQLGRACSSACFISPTWPCHSISCWRKAATARRCSSRATCRASSCWRTRSASAWTCWRAASRSSRLWRA